MFDFVTRMFSKIQKLEQSDKNQKVTKLNVIVDENGIKIDRLNGKAEEIKRDEIGEISLITTSEGPVTDDVYLCLHSIDGKTGCAIPSTTEGYNQVYDIVSKYEGFDFKKVIEAMSWCTDAKFTLWKKVMSGLSEDRYDRHAGTANELTLNRRCEKDFPEFKYNPDPIKARVIEKNKTICPVCGQEREYVYVGPFYSIEDVEGICPWCIQDGSAAKKYDGDFLDVGCLEDVENDEFVDELIHRSPGYFGWQQEKWLSHCGDFCAFIDYVGWKEIKDVADDLVDDIEKIKRSMRLSQMEFRRSLVNGGSHQGYLFRCLKCGKYRLTTDLD